MLREPPHVDMLANVRAQRAEYARVNLTGKARSEFLRALGTALYDPQVAPVARHIDWSAPRIRAAAATPEASCGGISPDAHRLTSVACHSYTQYKSTREYVRL